MGHTGDMMQAMYVRLVSERRDARVTLGCEDFVAGIWNVRGI